MDCVSRSGLRHGRLGPLAGWRQATPNACHKEGSNRCDHVVSQRSYADLMDVAGGRHRNTVELLLDWGADMEAKNRVSSATRMPFWGRTERAWSGRTVDCDSNRDCVKAGLDSWLAGGRWRPSHVVRGCGR